MTANSQAMCSSFKKDLLNGVHAFSAAYRTIDSFKAALHLANQGLGATTTAYGSNTATSTASTIAGTVLTIGGTVAGVFVVGMKLNGAGITANTIITADTGGAGGAGTYTVNNSQSISSQAINSTGELTGTNYTAGGVVVTNTNIPTVTGTTAFWTPAANFVWTTLTSNGTFDSVLLYNDTAAGKNGVSVHTFGAQNVTAGTFTLTMPANAASTALLNLA